MRQLLSAGHIEQHAGEFPVVDPGHEVARPHRVCDAGSGDLEDFVRGCAPAREDLLRCADAHPQQRHRWRLGVRPEHVFETFFERPPQSPRLATSWRIHRQGDHGVRALHVRVSALQRDFEVAAALAQLVAARNASTHHCTQIFERGQAHLGVGRHRNRLLQPQDRGRRNAPLIVETDPSLDHAEQLVRASNFLLHVQHG